MCDGDLHLARAVVAQALSDSGLYPARGFRHVVTPYEQAEAISFLTAGGEWLRARTFWCSLADIDPGKLREHALSALPQQRAPEPAGQLPPRREPRVGTKERAVFDQLRSLDGLDVNEMAARLSWHPNSVHTCMTDLRNKYGVKGQRSPDDRYRLVEVLN